jgi:hypothetical protein
MDMQLVETSKEIDLTTWNIGLRTMTESIGDVASQALREQFSVDPPDLYLPIVFAESSDGFHGSAVTDPLTIYVALPLAANADEHVVYAISLNDVIDDEIEMGSNFGCLPEALRALAKKIDAVTSKTKNRDDTIRLSRR